MEEIKKLLQLKVNFIQVFVLLHNILFLHFVSEEKGAERCAKDTKQIIVQKKAGEVCSLTFY